MFADTLNADYSLSAGSPCIDAGAYRPDLPDFDIRYHQRVVPGSVGGPDSVDIGAYEYNSVYIGGINGYVYDALSGLPIDCVKIDISGKLPEFSDTLGCFQYPSGAGIYTVKASRWDYEDLIIPNVQVSLGEETQLAIALTSTTVANDDAAIPPVGNQLALVNHPNPFRNETRIGFVLPESGHIQLAVYNIKGQKIKTIVSQNAAKGHHSLLWDGKDSQGRAVGSGIYFLRLDSGNIHSVHRMMLI
ncbi:MAG: FlgD immunoglobulin-like domain containing protein, partial [Candidatus Cloacimonadaceae bacterium]|nr:FlgD immunoglobulin-like domain containing protein [Candidatus Cloacimonadaceae bacterium]